jgi:hypothetical protein
VEFKELNVSLPDLEGRLVTRVEKIVIACLNARQDATLVLGKYFTVLFVYSTVLKI